MTDFAELQRKYRQWLADLQQILAHEQQQLADSLSPAVQAIEVLKAYVEAGRQLTADETRLFIETFFRQRTEPQQPDIWPEALWQALAAATDQTQVAWQELELELTCQGLHQADALVGMGIYSCQQCGDTQHLHHPAPLLICQCGCKHFIRRGIPL